MKTIWGETIWWCVYGVFRDDECLYVGMTMDAFVREVQQKRRFGKASDFKIFQRTRSPMKASQLEDKYIRKYRSLGQAAYNKNGGR